MNPPRAVDPVVERAISAVRRADFLPPDQQENASGDYPLPIGFAQTTSQPSLVAGMTRMLAPISGRVLEIGTGSGYQTAILAETGADVFTVELIAELAATAQARLYRLGYPNIHFKVGDGSLGWPEYAPFARIVVAAAPPQIPAALVQQLDRHGRMIIPIGGEHEDQVLIQVDKGGDGTVAYTTVCAVRFVPLVTPQ